MASLAKTDEELISENAQMLTVALTEGIDYPFAELLALIDRQVEDNVAAARRWTAAVRRVHQSGLLADSQAETLIFEIGHVPGVRRPKGWEDALRQLLSTESKDSTAWKVSYPSPETQSEEDAKAADNRDAGHPDDYESAVASRMEQWRQAVTGGEIWTVDAVLAFAFSAAHANEAGAGDICIESILRSRAIGVIGTGLSYLLLDHICAAMIDDADPISESIEEQMNEMGLDSAWRPVDNPDLPQTRVEMWQELRAAQRRREDILKAKILREKGETEMARLMLDDTPAFRARLFAMATEWGVDATEYQ